MANTIDNALRRDRAILIAGLIIISLLAWVYTINLSFRMSGGSSMDMTSAQVATPNMQAWQIEDLLLTFLMWAVMMVAMMIPSAAPMILAFARLNRQRKANETPVSATSGFLAGYLVVWTSFGAGATLVQWGLHSVGLLSPKTMSVTPILGGILLILAGLYQFTPFKYTCLSYCRTPLSFLTTEWREGIRGALIMGLKHGLYCLGCCWSLMLLLFVAGVMNLLWVALIAGFVLVEKVASAGRWVSRSVSLVAIGWGAWLLIQAFGG